MKQKGFDTHLIAVTADPSEAMVRAFLRAKSDGRWVSSDEIARAHKQFNRALKSYLSQADRADVLDTTLKHVREVARKEKNNSIDVENPELYDQIHERGK